MNFSLKLSFLVIVLCVVISLINQMAKPESFQPRVTLSASTPTRLSFNFYKTSCPMAEAIIRSTFQELYELDRDTAPALIRMVFHDCFVHGCDASVLLDSSDGIRTEKKEPQNQSLKKFEVVDTIKSRLEEKCPGVVSCADILVLAARESIIAVGGPFYPLYTGRRDSIMAFPNETSDLPSPHDNRSAGAASFASKGFTEQELVILLGAHSTGRIHCEFIRRRLHNFTSIGGPDPSIDPKFLETLRAKCNGSLDSPSHDDPAMRMDYEGIGRNFGTVYYRSLLLRKGLTFLDQQMTSSKETEMFVNAYANDASQFQKDFSDAMTKLSTLNVLVAPNGQIRRNCSKVNVQS